MINKDKLDEMIELAIGGFLITIILALSPWYAFKYMGMDVYKSAKDLLNKDNKYREHLGITGVVAYIVFMCFSTYELINYFMWEKKWNKKSNI